MHCTSKWHPIEGTDLGVQVVMSVRMTRAEFIRADKTITSQSAVQVPQGRHLQLLTSQLPGGGRRKPATQAHGAAPPGPSPCVGWTCYFQSFSSGTISCSRNKHEKPAFPVAKWAWAATLAHLNFSGLLSDSYSEFPKVLTRLFSNGVRESWCILTRTSGKYYSNLQFYRWETEAQKKRNHWPKFTELFDDRTRRILDSFCFQSFPSFISVWIVNVSGAWLTPWAASADSC